MELPERGQQLKSRFIRERGFWVEEYEGVVALCPDFLEAHLASSTIATKAEGISPLFGEFIAIAIDVSTTHLFESGLRLHMRNAFNLGATPLQIATVIQLVSSIGVQSQLVGLPILDEVVAGGVARGSGDAPLSAEQEELKTAFIAHNYVWSSLHDRLLRASPAYFAAQLKINAVIVENGALSPRERALIMVAANGSVTHLQTDALRLSIKAALLAGASVEDITFVLRRVSSLGMHSCMFGFPILMSEMERKNEEKHMPSAEAQGIMASREPRT